MRDAHWHPVTAETGHVAQGRARMRILDPDVTLDEYELKLFFDQATPGDIGYRTTATVFSREVMASTLGVDEGSLPDFPFTTADPLIVARKNPTPPAREA